MQHVYVQPITANVRNRHHLRCSPKRAAYKLIEYETGCRPSGRPARIVTPAKLNLVLHCLLSSTPLMIEANGRACTRTSGRSKRLNKHTRTRAVAQIPRFAERRDAVVRSSCANRARDRPKGIRAQRIPIDRAQASAANITGPI